MSEKLGHQPFLIDHVPSQEEIVAASKLEAEFPFGDVMSHDQLNVILRGSGVSTADVSKERYRNSSPQTPQVLEYGTPSEGPYVPEVNEMTLSGEELRELREQLANRDSNSTQ